MAIEAGQCPSTTWLVELEQTLQNPEGVIHETAVQVPSKDFFYPLPAGTNVHSASCMLSGRSGQLPHLMPLVIIYSRGNGLSLRSGHIYQATGPFVYDEVLSHIVLAVIPTTLMDLGPAVGPNGPFIPNIATPVRIYGLGTPLGRRLGGGIHYRGDPGVGALELDDYNEHAVQILFSGYIASWDSDNQELIVQASVMAITHQETE
ncbi:uncharacterized protein MELLADRAFT_103670 [Melampsora larici-populina 98AG31]|uniref:Uncharacterized protein n=1 Tax=Melampsora larici-populina (strain 98AG31 / pathotype 3-4-7) TaxID=747676 RepID=F4RC33_MELLP|nr:uncharacterized protein MELLADRAFT_103670 [Melampsora larici-populina 98AG31]EGG10230.1 hypothetical protein MELLADRAFT_103670 [Melampsora larici-populina 98AG31]